MPHTTDIDLTDKDIGGLTSADALMSFFGRLGYETDARKALTPAWAGLTDGAAVTIKKIELLSQDSEVGGPYLQVVFVQPKSLTAKLRTEMVRALGNKTVDYLLVLTTDFETLEFVLIDKPKTEPPGAHDRHPAATDPADHRRQPASSDAGQSTCPAPIHLDLSGRHRPVRQAEERVPSRGLRERLLPEPEPLRRLLPGASPASTTGRGEITRPKPSRR